MEEEIAELVQSTPKPDGYLIPRGATSREVELFEKRTSLIIPTTVRRWLGRYNGTLLGPGGTYGIHTGNDRLEIEDVLSFYTNWPARGWLPVASDGCGNHYVVDVGLHSHGHPVYFVETVMDEDRAAYVVGSDIWRFFRFLLRREIGEAGWPFNKQFVLNLDPDLEKCETAPLAWNA